MCAWTATASFPKTRAGSSPASSTSFFEHYVEYDFTADLEEKLDEVSAGDLGWKAAAARFLGRVLGRHRRDQGPQDHRRHQLAERNCCGPHIFPAEHAGRRPAQMPGLRRRRVEPQARPLRRLRRLLELSRMPLHAPARPEAPKMRATASRRNSARIPRPAKRSRCARGRFGPLRATRRGEEAQARGHPQGHRCFRRSISNMR